MFSSASAYLLAALVAEIVVRLAFQIDGATVEFERHWFTGKCTLRSGTDKQVLPPPVKPFDHLSTRLLEEWQAPFRGHEVVIEKERPIWYPGMIWPQRYRVFVDGELAAEREGFGLRPGA